MPFHIVERYMIFMVQRSSPNVSQNQIDLFDSSDNRFAVLKFTVGTMPAPQVAANGTYILYFPLEQYEKTIDVLRNEKPVYFWWGGEDAVNYLRTGEEDVGDAELVD